MRGPEHLGQLAEGFGGQMVALVDSGKPHAEVVCERDLGKVSAREHHTARAAPLVPGGAVLVLFLLNS